MPTFTPPVADLTPPVSVADGRFAPPTSRANPLGYALMRHYPSRSQGINVFKLADGTYQRDDVSEPYPATTEVVNDSIVQSWYDGQLTDDPVANPVVQVYYGGHSYEVSEDEATDLTNAGYGAYLS